MQNYYYTWRIKLSQYPHLNIKVSDILQRTASQQQRDAHIDIADLLIEEWLA